MKMDAKNNIFRNRIKPIFIAGINYPEFAKEGEMHFTLCDWINSNETYKEFYKNENAYKITDNMAAENGISSACQRVIESARSINSNEIWASDKLYDKDETIRLTTEFLSCLTEEDRKRFKIVGLPQGKTFNEWMECYMWMLNNKDIDIIAISKYSVESFADMAGTKNFAICRIVCIEYLHEKGLVRKPLHCAGANPLIIHEIKTYRKYSFVRSIDSNIAFKLGVHKIKIDECVDEPKERLNHHIDNLDEEQLSIIRYNINKIKEAIYEF